MEMICFACWNEVFCMLKHFVWHVETLCFLKGNKVYPMGMSIKHCALTSK